MTQVLERGPPHRTDGHPDCHRCEGKVQKTADARRVGGSDCKPALQCRGEQAEAQQDGRSRNQIRNQRAEVVVRYRLHVIGT